MTKADQLLKLAKELNNENKFLEAEAILMEIKEDCIDNYLWYYRLAYAYVFTNRFKAAIDLLKISIKLEKNFPFSYSLLAPLYYWQGYLLRAFKCALTGWKYCKKNYPDDIEEFNHILNAIHQCYPFVNNQNPSKSVLYHKFTDYDNKADISYKVKNLDKQVDKLTEYLLTSNVIEKLNLQESSIHEGSFMGFILLDEPVFDIQNFINTYQRQWHKYLPMPEITSHKIISGSQDRFCAIELFDYPIATDSIISDAESNFRWTKALHAAQNHKAFLAIIYTDNRSNPDLTESAKEFVRLMISAATNPHTIGINTLGTIFEPGYYCDKGYRYLKEDLLPIENLVFIGLYPDNFNSVSAYTCGLSSFGKPEMEIIQSPKSARDIHSFLLDVAIFSINKNAHIEDGDTLGFVKGEKVPVTLSPGVAIPGNTLKLAFHGYKANNNIIFKTN